MYKSSIYINVHLISIEMTDNTDKLRAVRAEKQVDRLERELELMKSRIKVSLIQIKYKQFG
jgi:hypothetical protein